MILSLKYDYLLPLNNEFIMFFFLYVPYTNNEACEIIGFRQNHTPGGSTPITSLFLNIF